MAMTQPASDTTSAQTTLTARQRGILDFIVQNIKVMKKINVVFAGMNSNKIKSYVDYNVFIYIIEIV